MNEEKTHYIAITGIIYRNGKYLICKRSEKEKIFPNKWCVPGGKIEKKDFINTPKDTKDHWFNVLEKALTREILEETNIEITNITYVSNLALLRSNGYSTIIISMSADYKKGEVTLNKEELTEHAWVTLEDAKNYDLIENIWEQLEKVEKIRAKNTNFHEHIS